MSVERAAKLLKICIPVETALKRLLIYVWSEIVTVLKGKHDKKAKIEICTQINELYLGGLLKLLEVDLSPKKRENLFANNGKLLFEIMNNSEYAYSYMQAKTQEIDGKQKLIIMNLQKTERKNSNNTDKKKTEPTSVSEIANGAY